MKQPKQKSPVKSARKTAKLDIQERLIATVKAIASKFGQDESKLTKKFQKKSEKLAKKISKELKIAKPSEEDKPKAPSSAVKTAKAKTPTPLVKKEIDGKSTVKTAVEKKVSEKKPQPAKTTAKKS